MWKFRNLFKKKVYVRYQINDHEIIEALIVKTTRSCLQISFRGRGFSTNTLWIVKNDSRIKDMDGEGIPVATEDAENVVRLHPSTRT